CRVNIQKDASIDTIMSLIHLEDSLAEELGLTESQPHNNNQNQNNNQNPNQNVNVTNDPLHLSSSDHPGMTLTNTSFNGSNFHGWNRNVRMALGAKLKFEFIDGSCPKPGVEVANLQRWIRCDYMEIAERYGQSNGLLIYQLERELSKITQGNLTIASYFNKLKKC
nr:hypothetical protein CTI12_AA401880 [Tanacetum cinerariifolium]